MRKLLAVLLAALAALPAAAQQQKKGAELLNQPPRSDTSGPEPEGSAPIQIALATYCGWRRSIFLGNGQVEAVIVPAIGRLMEFRFVGEDDGPFWENFQIFGRLPDPAATNWTNFGGDKTWPAPQADWPKLTPRPWPPPRAFDAMPVEARIVRDAIVLISPVDPHYGIRTERRIHLDAKKPVLTIETTYEKTAGAPVRVAVWIITQLEHPLGVYALLPQPSRFPDGFNRQSETPPAELEVADGLLSLARDPTRSTKIGTDAGSLLWVGRQHALRIDSPRLPGAEYPDQQSSAEIYTNPDPLRYVELEMLGPMRELKVGDRLSQTNTYTLYRRRSITPRAEARRLLGI